MLRYFYVFIPQFKYDYNSIKSGVIKLNARSQKLPAKMKATSKNEK